MAPFSVDDIILGWAAANPVTLGIIYGFLKILAKRSKTTIDDSILTMLGGALRVGKKQEPISPPAPTPPGEPPQVRPA
jgi:hypothetical protein